MPEPPEPAPEPTSAEPAAAESKQQEMENDAGDFIARHVLDKDSVFFEG